MFDFNLEYYRAFYFVAQLKSISKAANALFISQPAVSQSIQKLEQYFDTKLFYRKSRSTELTPAGEILFKYVEQAFQTFLEGENKINMLKSNVKGTLSISSTETPLYSMILPALDIFREKYPDIQIQLFGGGSTSTSIRHLASKDVDIAFGVTPFSCPDEYRHYEGLDFPTIAVVGAHFPIIESEDLTPKQLSNYPIICPGKDSSSYEQISHWFTERGILFKPAYSVQTSSTIKVLTQSNYGIGILPRVLVEQELNTGILQELPLTEQLPHRRAIAVTHPQFSSSSLCEAFLQILFQSELLIS